MQSWATENKNEFLHDFDYIVKNGIFWTANFKKIGKENFKSPRGFCSGQLPLKSPVQFQPKKIRLFNSVMEENTFWVFLGYSRITLIHSQFIRELKANKQLLISCFKRQRSLPIQPTCRKKVSIKIIRLLEQIRIHCVKLLFGQRCLANTNVAVDYKRDVCQIGHDEHTRTSYFIIFVSSFKVDRRSRDSMNWRHMSWEGASRHCLIASCGIGQWASH